MKLRYLFVDHRPSRQSAAVRGRGSLARRATTRGISGSESLNELRLVSVLCNNRLLPRKIFPSACPYRKGVHPRKLPDIANLLPPRLRHAAK